MSKITFLKLISLCKKWSWWWYTVNGRSQFKWKMYSNVLVGNLYTDIVLCIVFFVLFIPNVSVTIIINNILHICQFWNNLSTDMHDFKRYYIHLHYKKNSHFSCTLYSNFPRIDNVKLHLGNKWRKNRFFCHVHHEAYWNTNFPRTSEILQYS